MKNGWMNLGAANKTAQDYVQTVCDDFQEEK